MQIDLHWIRCNNKIIKTQYDLQTTKEKIVKLEEIS